MLEFKSYSKTPRLKNVPLRITQKLNGTNSVIAISRFDSGISGPNQYGPVEFAVGSRNQWLPSPEEIEQRNKEIKEWEEDCKNWIPCVEVFPLENNTDKSAKPLPKPKKLYDHHGFSEWAYENKKTLIKFLGEGYHYGEWCGPGIQNGEGLAEKGFYLFSPMSRYLKQNKLDYDKARLCVHSKGLHFVPELYNSRVQGDLHSLYSIVESCIQDLQTYGTKLTNLRRKVAPEGLIVEFGTQKFKIKFGSDL